MPHAKYDFGARGMGAASAHFCCPDLRRSSRHANYYYMLSVMFTRCMLSVRYGVHPDVFYTVLLNWEQLSDS